VDNYDRDRRNTEDTVQTAVFVAIGLGVVNVIIIVFIGLLILKGSVWIPQ